MALLTVDRVAVVYAGQQGIPAVQDISFSLPAGDSLGLIGESGCGKTTVVMAILHLLGKKARMTQGSIRFAGQDLTSLSAAAWQKMRGHQIALIPQGSQQAFNPVLTIGRQFTEHLCWHSLCSRKQAMKLGEQALAEVGLSADVLHTYPHQLSGGMRQRVAIAMALSLKPQLIIADEPTNALDVLAQEQVLALFQRIREAGQTALLLISHDMGVVSRVCERVCVIHQGHLVETGACGHLLREPEHPYTKQLLQAFWALRQKEVKPCFA